MGTNVPGITWTSTGFVAPPEPAILTGVQADYNAAFGGNLNPALVEPQGQLASSTAAILADNYDQMCAVFNGVDPALASGQLQDAIGAIYFLTRNPAQPTTVNATCSGATGVLIPVGALAIATDGNLYICAESGTIPSGGSITLPFACEVDGPIACPANSLNAIYQAIPGWDSVNNASDGVEGNNVETPQAFELRRQQSVAANSQAGVQAVLGAIWKVAGVLDAYVIENDTGAPLTLGDYTLLPNSIYCAVVGGVAASIAQAIWSKKNPGCAYNGNQTFTVYDENPLYSPPYPAYTVKFETPTDTPVYFAVTLKNNAGVPANATTLVQNAVINAFIGGDGGVRARLASTIFASRFYAPVMALGSWVQIESIQVGLSSGNANFANMGIDQEPVTSSGDITVSLV